MISLRRIKPHKRMMFLGGSSAGLQTGCTGGVLAASRRRTEDISRRAQPQEGPFSRPIPGKKTAKIAVYPTPLCDIITFSTIKIS
jgi:hypothetical protein